MRTLCIATVMVLLGSSPALASKKTDQKFWAAVRKDNAVKVARFLDEGKASPDSRTVALSISVSDNKQEAFSVLWNHDNSDISSDAIDYALCYAYRQPAPAPTIQEVLDERSLTISACCEGNSKQAYCARRPVKLTDRDLPATECRTVYTEEEQVPAGATRVAVLWDERVSVLDSASSAKYGPHKVSKIGVRAWAMEFASVLGELGADAILITMADTDVASESAMTRFPARRGGSTVSGFIYGTVTDRIEIVGIRTSPLD